MEIFKLNDREDKKNFFASEGNEFEIFFIYKKFLFLKRSKEPLIHVFVYHSEESFVFSFSLDITFIQPLNDGTYSITNFCAVDRNNIFFTVANKIYDINIDDMKCNEVKCNYSFDEDDKIIINVKETMNFPKNKLEIIFGFVASKKSLFFVYKSLKEDFHEFNAEKISFAKQKSTSNIILDVSYSYVFRGRKNPHFVALVFTTFSVYYTLIQILPNDNLGTVIQNLNLKWSLIYENYSTKIPILHSTCFNTKKEDYIDSLLINDDTGLHLFFLNYDWDAEYNNSKAFNPSNIPQALLSKVAYKNIKILHHYLHLIYVVYNEGGSNVTEINLKKSAIKTITNPNITEKPQPIVYSKILILDNQGFPQTTNTTGRSSICAFSPTTRNLFLLYSDNLAKIPLKPPQTISNISILSINSGAQGESGTDSKLTFNNSQFNSTTSLISPFQSPAFESQSPKVNPLAVVIKCSSCQKRALYQCDLCHQFFSCSSPCIHQPEWEYHKEHCPCLVVYPEPDKDASNRIKFSSLPELNRLGMSTKLTPTNKNGPSFMRSLSSNIPSSGRAQRKSSVVMNVKAPKEKIFLEDEYKLIPFTPGYNSLRNEIIVMVRNQKYFEAIEKSNILISRNLNKLNSHFNKRTILNFNVECVLNIEQKLAKFSTSQIINSIYFYQEYFSNIILCIYVYTEIKSKDKVTRMINHLISEMEYYNIGKVIDYLSFNINSTIKPNSNYENIFIQSLKIYILICKYSYVFNQMSVFEKHLINFVQKIQNVFFSNRFILCNCYLLLGNLYFSIGEMKKSHMLYETIIAKNMTTVINEKMYDVLLASNFNSGLIFYLIGKCNLARLRVNDALKIKLYNKKEKDDKVTASIYEILAQIDIQSEKYSSAFNNLNLADEALNNSSCDPEEDIRSRIKIMKEYIEAKTLNEEENTNEKDGKNGINLNKANHYVKHDDAEDEIIFKDFLGSVQEQPKISREYSIPDIKLFYLFIASLNSAQINKLNLDQPKDIEATKKLPIVFTEEFKESLNHKQRLKFCDLRLTHLTRIKVLKNYNKKIKIKNLNYNPLYPKERVDEISKIKSNYSTKKILQNWEIDPNENAYNYVLRREAIGLINEKMKIEEERKKKKKQKEISDVIKNSRLEKLKKKQLLEDIFERENFVNVDTYKEFLEEEMNKYYKDNPKAKRHEIDNDFMMILTREMDKESLKKIILNPQIVPGIVESYFKNIDKEGNIKKIEDRKHSADNSLDESHFEDFESKVSSPKLSKKSKALEKNKEEKKENKEDEKEEKQDNNKGHNREIEIKIHTSEGGSESEGSKKEEMHTMKQLTFNLMNNNY